MLPMRLLAEIDVLADGRLLARMARASVAVLVAGLAACVATGLSAGVGSLAQTRWWVFLVVGSALALPVHELVHAAAFKLLSPGCRVTFGAQACFLYTDAHGAVLTRGRMTCVLLAPAVAVTLGLAACALCAGEAVLAVALGAVHLSGCVGDVLMAAEAWSEPACTHVRDTDSGVELLSADDASGS